MVIGSSIKEFRSRHHPLHRSRRHVFSIQMARPLAACMIPVMILGFVMLLQGKTALPFLFMGFPLALLLAAAWTSVRIRDLIVEVHIRGADISLRSLLSAAEPRQTLSWLRILDLQRCHDVIRLTLGHEFFHIRLADWPEREHLIRHLEKAASDHAIEAEVH